MHLASAGRREEKAHGKYVDVGDHSVDLQAEERHVQRAMPNVPTEQRSGSQRRPASGVSESRGRRTVMAVAWWSGRPSVRAVSFSCSVLSLAVVAVGAGL